MCYKCVRVLTGNIFLSTSSRSHSFDEAMLNASHTVNVSHQFLSGLSAVCQVFTFGNIPSSTQLEAINDLPEHEKVVLDALKGKSFITNQDSQTIHHYLKVCTMLSLLKILGTADRSHPVP